MTEAQRAVERFVAERFRVKPTGIHTDAVLTALQEVLSEYAMHFEQPYEALEHLTISEINTLILRSKNRIPKKETA